MKPLIILLLLSSTLNAQNAPVKKHIIDKLSQCRCAGYPYGVLYCADTSFEVLVNYDSAHLMEWDNLQKEAERFGYWPTDFFRKGMAVYQKDSLLKTDIFTFKIWHQSK